MPNNNRNLISISSKRLQMNMILISANFQKMNLVSFFNLQTSFFQGLINCFAEYYSPILGWTNKMIQQYTDIMRFMYVLTCAHPHKDINYAASGGELTPEEILGQTEVSLSL